jgi:CCR4-NOT transcription complex subunit 6
MAQPPGPSQSAPPSSNPNGPLTRHLHEQLTLANISRQSSSAHHHARAAHLQSRGHTNAAIAITDPNKPHSSNESAFMPHRKADSIDDSLRSRTGRPYAADKAEERPASPTSSLTSPQAWTALDLGGMKLKNLSPSLFSYSFLTILYVPHNNLSSLPPAVASLRHLVRLDASGNKLTSLPAELGMVTSLRELLLFDNHLASLPPELGTLHQLDLLGIEGNPLPEQLRHILEREGTSALIAFLRDSCPVLLPPPDREWVPVESEGTGASSSGGPGFSVLCYNILCEKYATGSMYGYTPSWALNWDYRKELILQEIENLQSDIICLQVCPLFHLCFLRDAGIDTDFRPRTGSRFGAIRRVLPTSSRSTPRRAPRRWGSARLRRHL